VIRGSFSPKAPELQDERWSDDLLAGEHHPGSGVSGAGAKPGVDGGILMTQIFEVGNGGLFDPGGKLMSRKYVAFDLETAKILPSLPGNLKAHRPLGITCAATLVQEQGEVPAMWYSRASDGTPAPQMNEADLQALVRYLSSMVEAGYTILTWNGLNFDFDILAEESGLTDECKALAWQHVDMMFDFFCRRGFMVALDNAAKGLGLKGKTEGMSGDMAPRLWAEGKHQEVLEYVGQDALTTMQVPLVAEGRGDLRWVTQGGTVSIQRIASGWLPAASANDLPLPTLWGKSARRTSTAPKVSSMLLGGLWVRGWLEPGPKG